jgi:hypothetical protein
MSEPRIAILTSDGRSSFQGNRKNFIDIITTGKKNGCTVYVLTPKGLSHGDSFVIGYLLTGKRGRYRWKKAKLPLPHIVYNRVPNRQAEQSPAVQQALSILQSHPTIQLFNPSFFDKWTLYQQLQSVKELRPYLPETVLFQYSPALKAMVSKYPLVYLKPVHSKAGIGMIQIASKETGFEVVYQTQHAKKRYYPSTFEELWALVQHLCQKKKYLIQQGISLSQYRGRPFDLRVLVQKNGQGIWDLTGIGIRIAGKDAISTHVPMGGRIGETQTILTETFGEKQKELREELMNLCLDIAQTLEIKQNRRLGEMSFDFGLDKEGKFWFFEANAKPMKFDEPHIRQLSLQRLIDYFLYLYHRYH